MSFRSLPPPNEGSRPSEYANRIDRLFRSEAPRLRRYFHRQTGDHEAARDLTQEAFLRLSGLPQYGEIRSPLAYLQRIARNLLIDRSRRKAMQLAAAHSPYDENFGPHAEPEQNYAIEARDLLKRYERALDSLSFKTRRIFLMHRVDDMTYSQIGDALDISIGTVEYHMGRALAHLDVALGDD